jgi:hypothetical protein
VARRVESKENLLRDARALTPRVLLRIPLDGAEVEVLAGFRGDSLSLYFGEDPVYHFNAAGELRRAYAEEQLIKAEAGRLVFMRRVARDDETVLERRATDAAAEQQFFAEMQRRVEHLRTAVAGKQYKLMGEASTSGEAVPRLGAWLLAQRGVKIAASPRVT